MAALLALRVAGLDPATLAVGGAIIAVVIGLAAQQTLGNLIAGMVLIAARPFRVGDRVRLQAGAVAGQIEGVVASLGLLYTTFAQGQDSIMVPNNVVLGAAVVPLREPAAVDLRARLRPDVKPSDVQALLEDSVRTPVRGEPRISLEEIDSDEVVVRITATPESEADGPRLADEVLGRGRVGGAITQERDDGRADARRRRRRARLRLSRCPSAMSSAILLGAEAALERGGRRPGATPAKIGAARASPSGATSTSARSRSIARHDARRRRRSGVLVPTKRGSSTPGVVEHAARRG